MGNTVRTLVNVTFSETVSSQVSSRNTSVKVSAQSPGAFSNTSHAILLCKTPVRNDVALDVATIGATPTHVSPFSIQAAATSAPTEATLPPNETPVNTTFAFGNSVSAHCAIPALTIGKTKCQCCMGNQSAWIWETPSGRTSP